jgi:hypothetical protein
MDWGQEESPMMQLFLRRGLLMVAAVVSLFGISILPVSGAGDSVTVSVSASDPSDPTGKLLTYRWHSTDGQIINQNAGSTQWTLPAGPGIHFAYVLVSNGKGGYTERRIAVNTDGHTAVQPRPAINLIAPPAPKSSTVPFRAWIGGGEGSYKLGGVGGVTGNFKVALPDVEVLATGSPNNLQESTSTRLSGDLTFQAFSPQRLNISCTISAVRNLFPCLGADASFNPLPDANNDEKVDGEANQTNRINLLKSTNQPILAWVTGTALLQDGSTCGTENKFFGVATTAIAELVDIDGKTIPGSQVRANSWGQFSIPLTQSVHTSVVVRCEGAPPAIQAGGSVEIPAPSSDASKSFDVGVVTISGGAPIVSEISVSPAIAVTPAPPKVPLPSDIVPSRPAKFLAMKGLDGRLSGCLYYKTIGAVSDCDGKGHFLGGAISFEDWKRTVKIDKYAPPATLQHRALFVNRVDLNLTRDHHSVSYGLGATAGYVCNHLGPPLDLTLSSPAHQNDVEIAIENAAAGLNLVACVAMDYSVAPGVNNNQPFTRFLIFGPNGKLLPSVNLDGRGEKFVPGTCTVCHGGNKYAGKFPDDKTGTADLDAHFLPFDTGNFEFSKRPGSAWTKEAQQEAIYQLNQNVLNTNTNRAERELIAGWYPPGPHVQKEDFVPQGVASQDFYLNVIARSCRTCHIAQRDENSLRDLTFSEVNANGSPAGKPGAMSIVLSGFKELVCGQTDDLLRAYAMPNSAVTFDLFWKSPSNQPQKVASMPMLQLGLTGCKNPKSQ